MNIVVCEKNIYRKLLDMMDDDVDLVVNRYESKRGCKGVKVGDFCFAWDYRLVPGQIVMEDFEPSWLGVKKDDLKITGNDSFRLEDHLRRAGHTTLADYFKQYV